MDQPLSISYPFDAVPAAGTAQRVAPGIGWVRMPLPFALDHINLWLLEDGDGYTLVDSGIALDAVKQLWESLFATVCHNRPPKRLIVTHGHPDHLGLAHWLQDRLAIPVWMTQGEYLAAQAIREQLESYSNAAMLQLFRRHGLDQARLEALAARGNVFRRGVPEMPATFRRIIDGESIRIGDDDWRVMIGYGHSPEHASLYCERLGVLISGDMLLPRISTNISVYAVNPEGDPLKLFLDSLTRLGDLPADTLVLPSHGKPFRGLHARIAQLATHHRERCDVLLAACSAGQAKSAGELLQILFERELDTHQVMFGMGEAIAHLNYLEHGEEMRRTDGEDGIIRFATLR